MFVLVLHYHVSIYTGSNANSGTRAQVHITVVGTNGTTGKRLLYRSMNNDTSFQQGQLDVFEIDAVNLGKLIKVKLGHDGRQPGKIILRSIKIIKFNMQY